MSFIKPVRRISTIILEGRKQYGEIISKAAGQMVNQADKIQQMTKDHFYGPTADEVTQGLDLANKTCLVTGGNCGIGLEIIRTLVSRNCDVIMACRNAYTALSVTQNMKKSNERMLIYETNLASLDSVKKFCDKMVEDDKKLDMVILNAGIFGLPWSLTTDGFETTFQVNFLSQYYIIQQLEKILTDDARVVWLSSDSHRHVKWSAVNAIAPTPDLISLPKEDYTAIKAYNVSKLCGLLSMQYFSYRWGKTKRSIFCADPGSIAKTNLYRNWKFYSALSQGLIPWSRPANYAAATPVFCATAPSLRGHTAVFMKDCYPKAESDLAKDFHLSVRVNDLLRSLLYDRFTTTEVNVPQLLQTADADDTNSKTKTEDKEPPVALRQMI